MTSGTPTTWLAVRDEATNLHQLADRLAEAARKQDRLTVEDIALWLNNASFRLNELARRAR